MSIKDMVTGYQIIGQKLNDFLYEGRVKNGIKREHSKEELEAILESVRQECWENYSDGVNELGWDS